MDSEKRCWSCGSKEHFATSCPRTEESKPRATRISSKPAKKNQGLRLLPLRSPKKRLRLGTVGVMTMKVLIDEANRMLQTLQQSEPKEKAVATKVSGSQMAQLQKQLDKIKKATLKPFRLSKLGHSNAKGLLDSGATHPLRARRKSEKSVTCRQWM